MNTVKEIAMIHSVSLRTVYDWIEQGNIPVRYKKHRGICMEVVVDSADVDAFLKSKEE